MGCRGWSTSTIATILTAFLVVLATLAAGSVVELVPGRVGMEWSVDRERKEVTITLEATGLGER